jgi:hypothetical protein
VSDASALIDRARDVGIRLDAAGPSLVVRSHGATLPADLRAELVEHKDAVLTELVARSIRALCEFLGEHDFEEVDCDLGALDRSTFTMADITAALRTQADLARPRRRSARSPGSPRPRSSRWDPAKERMPEHVRDSTFYPTVVCDWTSCPPDGVPYVGPTDADVPFVPWSERSHYDPTTGGFAAGAAEEAP